MKRHITFISIALLVFCYCSKITAQTNGYFIKEKKTHKEHKHVHTTDTFSIRNSFGNIEIIAWDKDEIAVDIIASGISKNEAQAQELLDSITIYENYSQGKFDIGVSKRGPRRMNIKDNSINGIAVEGRSEEWESNTICRITVPRRIALDIHNHCGNVTIGDFAGMVKADISFGTINAGHLSGPTNEIHVNNSNGLVNKISAIDAGSASCSNSCCALTIANPVDRSKVTLDGWAPLTVGSMASSKHVK